MTREEAKAYIIQHCIPNYPKMDKTEWDAAMGKAIEALRQPDPRSFSCGQENDMVSRQAALDAIMGQPPEPHYPSWYAAQIEKLPAVQPATNCSEIPNGSDDTISRQAAINAALEDVSGERTHEFNAGATRAANRIKQLPSAQPEQVCVANVTLTDEQVKEVVEKAKNAVISVIELEPHWIPCSERLPERSIEVLTYTALVNLIEIQTLERDEHGFMYWENQHGDRQDMTVTAWMPLPEPYRGGDSE